jgi:hypothetical protein
LMEVMVQYFVTLIRLLPPFMLWRFWFCWNWRNCCIQIVIVEIPLQSHRYKRNCKYLVTGPLLTATLPPTLLQRWLWEQS